MWYRAFLKTECEFRHVRLAPYDCFGCINSSASPMLCEIAYIIYSDKDTLHDFLPLAPQGV